MQVFVLNGNRPIIDRLLDADYQLPIIGFCLIGASLTT